MKYFNAFLLNVPSPHPQQLLTDESTNTGFTWEFNRTSCHADPQYKYFPLLMVSVWPFFVWSNVILFNGVLLLWRLILFTRLDFIFKSKEIVQRRAREMTGGIEWDGQPGMNWVTIDQPGQAKSVRARERTGPAWKGQSRRGRNSVRFYMCVAGDKQNCTGREIGRVLREGGIANELCPRQKSWVVAETIQFTSALEKCC